MLTSLATAWFSPTSRRAGATSHHHHRHHHNHEDNEDDKTEFTFSRKPENKSWLDYLASTSKSHCTLSLRVFHIRFKQMVDNHHMAILNLAQDEEQRESIAISDGFGFIKFALFFLQQLIIANMLSQFTWLPCHHLHLVLLMMCHCV